MTEKTIISKEPSKKFKKINQLDPYFCHFILLSQSVKLTENKEEFLNLDMKPYYK